MMPPPVETILWRKGRLSYSYTLEEPRWTVEEAQRFSLEELHCLWRDLAQKFYRSGEIAKVLPSGHSAWVIQTYLRENVEIPSVQDEVLKQTTEGKTPAEIARTVRTTPRRVQQIIRESRGPCRTYNTTERNVDRFLDNPKKYWTARFTQSVPFGRSLLERCASEIGRSPVIGFPTIRLAVDLLHRVHRTRNTDQTKRDALCLLVQSRGIEAQVYNIRARYEMALRKSILAMRLSGDCIPCEADQLRQLGKVYASWKRWDESYLALGGSMARYRTLGGLGDVGHDLRGNGLANCFLLKSELDFCTVSPEMGALAARDGLKIMTGKESPILARNLVFALAKCLQPSRKPYEVEESQELLGLCFDNLEFAQSCSLARAMLYWLKGHLLVTKNRRDEAIECLTLALEDAQACEDEQDVGCILADLGALNPAPREIRGYIEDFCECQWSDEEKREILVVPAWCNKLEDKIRFLYDLSTKSRKEIDISVLLDLRKTAGGDKRMPSFILPPPPTGLEWDALR